MGRLRVANLSNEDLDKCVELSPRFTPYGRYPDNAVSRYMLRRWKSALSSEACRAAALYSGSEKVCVLAACDREWESERLGVEVRSIDLLGLAPDIRRMARPPIIVGRMVRDWLLSWNCQFGVARLPGDDVAGIRVLTEAGFSYVETYQTFVCRNTPLADAISSTCRPVSPDEHEEVGRIASEAYVHDRMHVEPAIDRATADNFKRVWAENSCKGYARKVLVREVDGVIAGFVTLREADVATTLGEKFAVIDLLGVAQAYQGRGVGRDLVLSALVWSFNQGYNATVVGTQATNYAAIGLYTSCGFKLAGTQVTLHLIPTFTEAS